MSFLELIQEYLIHSIDESTSDDDIQNHINRFVDGFTLQLAESLEGEAENQINSQKKTEAGFHERNYIRWKPAFDLLRVIIAISIETGDEFQDYFIDKINNNTEDLFDVLIRLHARACLTSKEILCLLESGFPDGAYARWRALHELAATSLFIVKHGNECAVRYKDHEGIDCYKRMVEHRNHKNILQAAAPSDEEFESAKSKYNVVLAKYEKSFKTNYGWAYEFNPSNGFRGIEEDVGLDYMRTYYRWASQNVHSGVNGTYKRLGLCESEEDMLLVGPSNGGMVVPAHSLAISLGQVMKGLLRLGQVIDEEDPNLDFQLFSRVIDLFTDKLGYELLRCDAKESLDD